MFNQFFFFKDILDRDKFWKEELVKANQDRLFGCWFKTLDGLRSGVKNASVDGLVGNLSHSIVKAVEIKGKRFVVLRDPWGEAGWEGAWSDGSKEWTTEWLEILPELGHSFGGSGQFVMECEFFFFLPRDSSLSLDRFDHLFNNRLGFLECLARNSENVHL